MIFAVSSTGGGGGGTVTTVSAGNLSPLFTTVVSTPTTSPSIAFTLVSQAANLVYASPDGGAGVPSFRSLVAADLPTPAIPITLNYIPKGTGTSIADGTWAFSTNDIYPLTTGSNIGDATHRIGTIFMASTFDYASDLNWITSASTKMTLTTGGDVGIGTSTPSYKLHVVPSSSGDAVYIERAGKHLFVNPNGISTGCDIETDNFMNFTSSGSFRFNGASQINLYGIAGTTNLYLTSDSTTNKGLYLYNINGDGTVVNAGLNISNPSASLHVKSTGNTSATYATKINDSSGNELLYVRNDGHIGIGADPATISTAYLYFKSTSALDFGYYNTITNLNAGGVGYYANVTGGAGVFGIQIDLAQTSGTGQAIRGIAGGSAGDLNIGVYGTGANSTSVSIGVKGNVPNGTSPENYAGYFNTQSEAGLSYGVYGAGIGVSTGTNYGGYFLAQNGANNYAIIVPNGGGSVGLGTTTPDTRSELDVIGKTISASSSYAIMGEGVSVDGGFISAGVVGLNTATTGATSYGTYGQNDSTKPSGRNIGAGGFANGVSGGANYGGFFQATGSTLENYGIWSDAGFNFLQEGLGVNFPLNVNTTFAVNGITGHSWVTRFLTTGGTEALHILNSNGYVGINAGLSPTARLHVVGSGGVTAKFAGVSTYDTMYITGGGSSSATYSLKINNASTDLNFYIKDDGELSSRLGYWIGANKILWQPFSVQNISVGYNNFTGTVTGAHNTALGSTCLNGNLSADYNTAIGFQSLSTNTSGTQNVAIGGLNSMSSNLDGSYNVAVGSLTGSNLLHGDKNILLGYGAMGASINGSNNISIGANTMIYATTNRNVAIGDEALYNLDNGGTSAGYCVALGNQAGKFETTNGSRLYIHNGLGVTDYNSGKNNSLLYGKFDASVANQFLVINAVIYLLDTITATYWSGSLVSGVLTWTDTGSANAPS